jgi:hypothetical protein
MRRDDFQFTLGSSVSVVRERCLNVIEALGWRIRRDLTQEYVLFCYVPIADLLPQAPVYTINLYPDGPDTHIALVAASDNLSQSHAQNDLPVLKDAILTGRVPDSSKEAFSPAPDTTGKKTTPATRLDTQKKCFISYRRFDSADVVGRIYDRLVAVYGSEKVFKDVDNIPIGADFRQVIDEAVSSCAVLLVVIGRDWLTVMNEQNVRRLDDPGDFVRVEIETALKHNIPVVPLLVREAAMPREEEMPASLKEVVYRHGARVRSDPDFHRDMDRLVQSLDYILQE